MSMIDDLKQKAASYIENAGKKKDELVEKAADLINKYDESQRTKMEDWVYKKEAELKELEEALKQRYKLIRKKERKLNERSFTRFVGLAAGLSVTGFFAFLSFVLVYETGKFSETLQDDISLTKSSAPEISAQSQESTTSMAEGEEILRSENENASYYLIKRESDGEYVKTLHSRVSSSSRGYSVTRIDCSRNRYQDLGYGDGQPSNIKMYESAQWTDLVPGSSKADLVSFVCRGKK